MTGRKYGLGREILQISRLGKDGGGDGQVNWQTQHIPHGNATSPCGARVPDTLGSRTQRNTQGASRP